MTFGETLRHLRRAKNLSQSQLAALCGLSLRTIRSYEVEGRYPRQRAVYEKLAAVLDCHESVLLSSGALPPDLNSTSIPADKTDLLAQARAFFLSPHHSEQEKDALIQALLALYWQRRS